MSPNPKQPVHSNDDDSEEESALVPEGDFSLSEEDIATSHVLAQAIRDGKLSDESPVALFMDTDRFQNECRALIEAFPPNTLHGFACKACPIVGLLKLAHEVGMGGECASEGEVMLCLAAGIPPSHIILDSPCKTDTILRKMLKLGVHMNADNLAELERIQEILEEQTEDEVRNSQLPSIGLRVNPQTGSGTIGMTSTAGMANKFGVPLKEEREEIIQAYAKYDFLTGVHVHVGSQGVSPQQLVDGAKAATDLADEINARMSQTSKEQKVTTIDIGGGLSVDYGDQDNSGSSTPMISMHQYASMLRDQVPNLFSKNYRIITEFGRRLAAPCGFLATRIQATKIAGGRKYVIGHIGADLLMRSVYAPQQWRHPILVHNAEGHCKRESISKTEKVDVAGPLCFSGDIIAKDRALPMDTNVGDHLVIRVAGGYTISIYSRHTSQLVPAVYGYQGNHGDLDNQVAFSTLKKAETMEDLVRFWGG